MKKITEIWYNWRQEVWDGSAGENYDIYTVGQNEVQKIVPLPETQFRGYKVYFEDGRTEYLFNPNKVIFEK